LNETCILPEPALETNETTTEQLNKQQMDGLTWFKLEWAIDVLKEDLLGSLG
jgi:hypothetical protein